MNISVITLFPKLYEPFFETSLFKRGIENKAISFQAHTLFEYVAPKERIDAPTFGHHAGMLIRPEIAAKAVQDLENKHGKAFKIFLSPKGQKLTQPLGKQLFDAIAQKEHLMIFAGRYEGFDARVEEEYADAIISIGDFVTMGGDLPAMVLMEVLFRHMPGIVGKQESVERDSFSTAFVEHPEYTKPVVWQGKEVPEVLRSGNHQAIEDWQREKSAQATVLNHFDWLRTHTLSDVELKIASTHIPSHYVALMHTGVSLKDGRTGNSSVTSIDVHDIARSAATYNFKEYFVVTPLIDQQKIVKTILDFWQEGDSGLSYNKDRFKAMSRVSVQQDLDQVLSAIEAKEGVMPIVLGTSAKIEHGQSKMITYHDQSKIWATNRPVLIVLGTAHGLGSEIIERCDYFLPPLKGFSRFNHLSVRSAAAVIFDKWLGFDLQR